MTCAHWSAATDPPCTERVFLQWFSSERSFPLQHLPQRPHCPNNNWTETPIVLLQMSPWHQLLLQVEILISARWFPTNWTRHYMARSTSGGPVPSPFHTRSPRIKLTRERRNNEISLKHTTHYIVLAKQSWKLRMQVIVYESWAVHTSLVDQSLPGFWIVGMATK